MTCLSTSLTTYSVVCWKLLGPFRPVDSFELVGGHQVSSLFFDARQIVTSVFWKNDFSFDPFQTRMLYMCRQLFSVLVFLLFHLRRRAVIVQSNWLFVCVFSYFRTGAVNIISFVVCLLCLAGLVYGWGGGGIPVWYNAIPGGNGGRVYIVVRRCAAHQFL
jgi:hypothetical protein